MAQPTIRLRFHGMNVEGRTGETGLVITNPHDPDPHARPAPIPWRAILIAPKHARLPIALVEPGDVDRVTEDFDVDRSLPDDLRRALVRVLDPPAHAGAADQAMLRRNEQLRADYIELGRTAELDSNSDELFLLAVEKGLMRSLTLYDERPGRGTRAPLPVTGYLEPLPQTEEYADWVPTSCKWDGRSILYEVNPPGRCLVLDGTGWRTDLCNLQTSDLTFPPNVTASQDDPVFVVRAAETTN